MAAAEPGRTLEPEAEQERALWRKAQAGDQAARERLVERHLPLVYHLANRFRASGIEYDELVQIGSVGLLKAVDGFDPDRGLRFSTYAVPVITGELLRFLRDDATVRVPRRRRSLAKQVEDTRARLQQQLGREPTLQELSDELGRSYDEILSALEATQRTLSLHENTGNDDEDPIRLLDRVASGDDPADIGISRAFVEEMLSQLEPRLRRILLLRYFQDLTQAEIAERLNLSQGQVSRLLQQALRALRARFPQHNESS